METVYDTSDDGMSIIETKAGANEGFGFFESAFIAGKNTVAGTITISNDYEKLYVTFATKDGWQMGRTHLFVGPKDILLNPSNGYVNSQGSPKNGHFPYGEAFDPMVTKWEFELPLIDLYAMFYGEELALEYYAEKFEICPVVAAHAEVTNVITGKKETAWGKGPNFVKKGNWSMYVEGYCVKFPPELPPPPPAEYELQNETAWAFDSYDHEYGGNWAKYIQFAGEVQTYTLMAGQKLTDMTVTLTPAEDGMVRMVFDGIVEIAPENVGKWVLQDRSDAVKIQGYESAPSGNPAPGQFQTYKGNELDIVVPAANYYGIHLDVAKLTAIQ